MSEWLATLVSVLGHALLQFLWQGVAIGLSAALALQLLRDARPQARYLAGCLALLACVLAPAASIVLGLATSLREAGSPVAVAPAVHFGTLPLLPVVLPAWRRIDDAMPLFVALWAAGASVFCLRVGLGTVWLRRLRGSAQGPGQPRWQARLDALAQRFRLQGVALRIVPSLDSPVAAGWLRPVVLLPTAVATRMPVDLVEALLAHELAHVRRHDYLVNLLQNLVEALLFYHPVVWWLSRRIRTEREHVADAMAAEAIGDPRRLAHALATLSELVPVRTTRAHAAPAAHGGPLMSRIQHLVRPGAQRLHAGRIALPALGIAVACMAFYAQAQIGKPEAASRAAHPATANAEHARLAVHAAAAEASSASAATVRAHARAVAGPHIRANGFARIDSDATRDAFALIREGEAGVAMSGSTRDLAAIDSARHSLDGDFLWFRRGDKAYVVVDQELVGRANAAWRDSNALGVKMDALGREMDVHGQKMEALGARMEKLAGGHAPSPALLQAQDRMQALAEEQQMLAGQQLKLARAMRKADEAERADLEVKSDQLSKQMEALGAQMQRQAQVIEAETAQLQRNRQPMEALGRQMEEAGKPMEALGARMEVLGTQQEQLVRKAEAETRDVIAEATRRGLAMPAPGSTRAQ